MRVKDAEYIIDLLGSCRNKFDQSGFNNQIDLAILMLKKEISARKLGIKKAYENLKAKGYYDKENKK